MKADLRQVETIHRLVLGDARDMGYLKDESIHLVVTSPPYWTLKRYTQKLLPPRGDQVILNALERPHF